MRRLRNSASCALRGAIALGGLLATSCAGRADMTMMTIDRAALDAASDQALDTPMDWQVELRKQLISSGAFY